jgi:transcriptional regulator with XRE-family HTH domain
MRQSNKLKSNKPMRRLTRSGKSVKQSIVSKKSNGKSADTSDLSRLAIGTRLRHTRIMRGARMKDVADAAGCSESLVSKIENNKLQPSLQVLHRLCSVLRISLGALFNSQQDDFPVVTRQGQRPYVEMDPLRRGKGIRMERVIPYTKHHLLQSNIHVVAPGGSSFGLISHEGEEVGYIIAGEIELFVGDKSYRLRAGDTFCFRSEMGHGYSNSGPEEARVLFVNTPPTF